MSDQRIPVFMSVGTPHLSVQEEFIEALKNQLRAFGFEPQIMGDNQYSYLSPLAAIRRVMERCHGAVSVGLERTHTLIGYDRQNSDREQEFTHRRLATPWCHLEAGMAYQIGLPLLILREDSLHVEGILDPAVSGHFVFSFCPAEAAAELPASMKELILSWGQAVRDHWTGIQEAKPLDSLEVFVDLKPGQVEDAKTIEHSLSVGLRRLKALTEPLPHSVRLEFANYEARLLGLLEDQKRHGSSETMRSEISRVVYELNRLALPQFDRTFSDLCIS